MLLGGAALGLVAVFFAVNFSGERVATFEPSDTSRPDALSVDGEGEIVASPTTTPVLVGPQGDESILTNPDNLTEFCLGQFFAEAGCAGVVRALCAEVGSTAPECIDALGAYCATSNPLPTYCRRVGER